MSINYKIIGKLLTITAYVLTVFLLKEYEHKVLAVCLGLVLTEIERAENRIIKKIESNQRR